MTTPGHITDTVTLIGRILARIEAHATTLQDIQWERGRRPASANDAGTRQRGGKPDPTGETATDAPRIRVRDALKATHRDLDRVARDLLILEARMALAIKKWEGEA
jgi:hypothetical protein